VTPALLQLGYSPWSERARWALDVRGVPYERVPYQPLLGELRLRWVRRGAGGASVPVLLTDEGPICDSVDIARWANARGAGPDLFPAGREAELAAIGAVADRALAAGRSRALRRMAASTDALQEQVPSFLRWTGPVARGIAKAGTLRTIGKYGGASDDEARTALLAALDALREHLARAVEVDGVRCLLGAFSWADINAAQALAFVRPPDAGLRMGPGTRAAFTDPYVAAVSADLLAWRDALYARHRG
jgi:glutathione S-transferase